MRDELYINGKKADIDSSTSISLNYKSNFLSDISKIVSNSCFQWSKDTNLKANHNPSSYLQLHLQAVFNGPKILI